MAPNVPRIRPLRRGTAGDDVEAWQRALWRSGHLYRKPGGVLTGIFGAATETATEHFQRDEGIQASGAVGAATWEAMERTRAVENPDTWAFDRYAIYLATRYAQTHAVSPEERTRAAIADYWLMCVAKRDRIAYSQNRPYERPPDGQIPRSADCSSFVTLGYRDADAPDPNGRAYDGLGYTGTLLAGGRPTRADELKIGDLVFYGFTTSPRPGFPYGAPTHVAGVVRRNRSGLWVASHGSQPGPVEVALYYRPVNSRTPFRTYDVT